MRNIKIESENIKMLIFSSIPSVANQLLNVSTPFLVVIIFLTLPRGIKKLYIQILSVVFKSHI